jgi:hypothetical protein
MEFGDWGVRKAEFVQDADEQVSRYHQDLSTALRYEVDKFNQCVGSKHRFFINLKDDDSVLTVGNGYKNIRVDFNIPPGVIQFTTLYERDQKPANGAIGDASLMLDGDSEQWIATSIPDECGNPEQCAVWILEEIFAV